MKNATPNQGGNGQPRLPWGGPQSGSGGKPNPFVQTRRAVRDVLAILNPVAAVLAIVLVVLLTRRVVMDRLKGWWVVAAGAVAGGVVLATLGLREYLRPWLDLGHLAVDHATHAGLGPAVVALVRDSWVSWLWAQAPLALCLAAMAAGGEMWRRQRYRAEWREDDDDPTAEWHRMSERAVSKAHRHAERALVRTVTSSTPFDQLQMRLGIDEHGRMVRLTGEHFRTHAVAIAPSGYGKTVTLTKLMQGWLVEWAPRRLPAVLMDLKGSPELLATVRAMCAETDRRCHVVTLRPDTDTYNPIAHGSAPQVASRVLSALANAADGGFSEPHHRVVGQRWLNLAVAVLDALIVAKAPRKDGAKWRRDLHHLAELMRPAVLIRHAAGIDGVMKERAEALHEEITETKDLAKSIAGMRQRLANLTETGAGHVLVEAAGGVDLRQVIEAGDVAVFSLSTGQNREAVQTLGNLLIADLAAVFGDLEEAQWADKNDQRALLVLDEFGALSGTGLVELIERARSAGGRAVVSAQTEANLVEVSPEFAEKVYSNSNVWLLGRQEGEAAEARAKAIGTTKGWQETKQLTEDSDPLGSVTGASGVGSLRRVNEFRIHPDEFKSLDPGQIILRVGYPATLKRVRVTVPKKWEPQEVAPADDEAPGVDLTKSTDEPTRARTPGTRTEVTTAKVSAPAGTDTHVTQAAAGDPWAEFDGDDSGEW